MSYQTSSKRSPPFWLLIGARKLLCFSAQSEGITAATVSEDVQIPAFQLWNHISTKRFDHGCLGMALKFLGQGWSESYGQVFRLRFFYGEKLPRERVTLPAQSSVYSNIQEKRWPVCASQEMTISVFPMKIELVYALILSFQAQLGEPKWV